MVIVGTPLGVAFAASGNIVCSKYLRLTMIQSVGSRSGIYADDGKEVSRATQSHFSNGTILSSHGSATACAVRSVYATGGDKVGI